MSDMKLALLGVHHLTAVSARIRENYAFYTRVMGMRLVKRSVNQDDVSAYHLFYADAVGTPGTDLTFFDWPVPREVRGTHSVVRTGLRVRDEAALDWWAEHLAEAGLPGAPERAEVADRPSLLFEDPEGQRLALVVDGGAGDAPVPWEASPVPEAHQIRGLGPVTLSVRHPGPTAEVLEGVLGMRREGVFRAPDSVGGQRSVQVERWVMGEAEGPHAEIHLAAEPHLDPVRPGAGGVHHVAFRVPDVDYPEWAERLNELRVPNSGKVDRHYFRSLYFREPGGILFELATEGPGFAVDEPVETLGEEVALPPFLEARRDQIVSNLRPLE
jgi:glyoxalase family protein